MKSIFLAGMLFLTGHAGIENPDTIEMAVSSSPSLPMQNMLRNGSFEEGLSPWATRAVDGVRLSEQKAYDGNKSLCITVEKGKGGKSLYCTGGQLARQLKSGETYILSGWVNASPEVSNSGSKYCGAGLTMSVYDRKWEKKDFCRIFERGKNEWTHIVSGVMKVPDWYRNVEISASVSYAHGTAFFDDIRLTEAYAELTISVKSRNIFQVIVEDETGRIVFDSGRLADSTDDFSKSIRVLSPYRYFIRAVNRSGTFRTVCYPEYPAGK